MILFSFTISALLCQGIYYGLDWPEWFWQNNDNQTDFEYAQAHRWHSQSDGAGYIAEEQKVKSELGVVFDTNYFSDDWKVSQVEKSISVFYPNWDSQKFADMLRKFHIAPTQKVKELSKGMQMKLMLACAFSYDAKLLILDEPTSGLDPVSRDELLKILSEYIEDGEHSVLFSTHITGDLERAADYITYISYGELYFTGSKDDFVDMFRIVKGGIEELSDDLKNRRLVFVHSYGI